MKKPAKTLNTQETPAFAEASAIALRAMRDKTARSSLRSEETRPRFAMAGVSKLLEAYSTALLTPES